MSKESKVINEVQEPGSMYNKARPWLNVHNSKTMARRPQQQDLSSTHNRVMSKES